MLPVYCDFETRSTVDLRKVGGKQYITHPTTQIMSGVFNCGPDWVVWLPGNKWEVTVPDGALLDTMPRIPFLVEKWVKDGRSFVGHNCELFDAPLMEEKCKLAPHWIDTLHLCRLGGLPGALGKATSVLLGKQKEDDTAMFLLTAGKVVGGKVVYPIGTPPLWKKLVRYNIADVELLKELHEALLNHVKCFDTKTIDVHWRINKRGFYIDRPWLVKLIDLWRKAQAEAQDEVEHLTDGALTWNAKTGKHDLGSAAKVKAWLKGVGVCLPGDSLDRKIVEQVLAAPEHYLTGISEDTVENVIALLLTRTNAVRSTVGKLERVLLEMGPDSCVRRCIVYHGAHTGRFSARAVQPHNFPRGEKIKNEPSLADLINLGPNLTIEKCKEAGQNNPKPDTGKPIGVGDVLGTLTRSIVAPRKGKRAVVCDYAAIEARGIAWVAECREMLDTFREGQDVYCAMGTKLYGRVITKDDEKERFVSKQVVLASGYQASGSKFAMMCKLFGVDLDAAGVTAEQCVQAYRKGFPEIPLVWKAYQRAATGAVRKPHAAIRAGKCTFESDGKWLYMELPSGRTIHYRSPRFETEPNPWEPGLIEVLKYTNPHGVPKTLYGGILAENAVQAIARDLLCEAMVRLDCPEWQIVLHVHDELVFEVAENDAEQALFSIGKAMSIAPAWADDFPIGVEGFIADHYTKGPIKPYKAHEFLTGGVL